MSATRLPTARGRARGFTLIEVLISILIFSVGVLGVVGLLAGTTQVSTQNTDRARASALANEIVAQMWAQQVPMPTTYTAWQTRVSTPAASGLPNGVGTVTVSGTTATVTVQWKPPTMASTATPNIYKTVVVIQ